MKKILILVVSIFLLSSHVQAAVPFTIGGDPVVDPSQFRITEYATGLQFPLGLVRLSDGALMVVTNENVSSSLFGPSDGTLRYLKDTDNDGVADINTILYTGLPGVATSVVQAGELFFVNSAEDGADAISMLRAGTNPSDPLTLLGSIQLDYVGGFAANLHKTFELAVRVTPGEIGKYDLLFNVGSINNDTSSGVMINLSGLVTATVNDESIYKITVEDAAGGVVFSNLQQIATGLRNAAGIEFKPGTGDLYFEDNGIDLPLDEDEPLSADEINMIPFSDIGGAVNDFGYSDNYTTYRTGVIIGDPGSFDQPLQVFQPIAGAESEGPFKIAFAPPNFPAGLNDGLFIGFHGKIFDGGVLNEENPLVYVDISGAAFPYFHFIANDIDGVGHLDEILSTDDSIFVVDLATDGGLGPASSTKGVIYQIMVLAAPVADAGSNQLVASGQNVVLNGSASSGVGALDYQWTQTAGPAVVLDDDQIVDPSFTAPFVGVDTGLEFELIVTDPSSGLFSDLDTVTITVLSTDIPVADAGDSINAEANSSVLLDGSASFDPDGNIVNYKWRRLPMIQASDVLCDGTDPACSTMALGRAEEVIELEVTDNDGMKATDTISIFYQPPANCGNSIVEPPEVCDSDTQSCVATGGYPGTMNCNSLCNGYGACTTTESCGDNIVNGPEICDGNAQGCTINGYAGNESCNNQCSGFNTCVASESCGDNIVNGPETCDGNSQACTSAGGYFGTSDCNSQCDGFQACATTLFCGDNICTNPPETCSICPADCGSCVSVEIIIDNLDGANTSVVEFWPDSSGLNPFAGNSKYHSTTLNGKFRWTPNITDAGTYDVYAWWTFHVNRGSNIPYRIQHSTGLDTVTVNQHDSSLAGQWNLLGSYTFGAGTGGYVEVSSENGQACADAVRFVK